jgi:hypothetical protein
MNRNSKLMLLIKSIGRAVDLIFMKDELSKRMVELVQFASRMRIEGNAAASYYLIRTVRAARFPYLSFD